MANALQMDLEFIQIVIVVLDTNLIEFKKSVPLLIVVFVLKAQQVGCKFILCFKYAYPGKCFL